MYLKMYCGFVNTTMWIDVNLVSWGIYIASKYFIYHSNLLLLKMDATSHWLQTSGLWLVPIRLAWFVVKGKESLRVKVDLVHTTNLVIIADDLPKRPLIQLNPFSSQARKTGMKDQTSLKIKYGKMLLKHLAVKHSSMDHKTVSLQHISIKLPTSACMSLIFFRKPIILFVKE